MKIRIEIHLSEQEAKALDKIAKQDDRSRKNFCETVIRSIIKSFDGQKKIKTNCV